MLLRDPSMNNMTMGRTKTHHTLRQLSNDISNRFNDYLPIFIFFVKIGPEIFSAGTPH